MTKVKKMLGMVMAALLCFALTPMAAFAADQMGSLKVENAVEGQTYNLYRIADLKVSSTNPVSYSYTPAAGWEGFWETIADSTEPNYGIKLENNGGSTYIVYNGSNLTESVTADLAVAAKNWASKPNPTDTKDADKDGVTFKSLQLGYYFLDSTTGTICSLTSMAPNETIKEKNNFPTIDKKVKENSTEQYGPSNNANIGDIVEFRTVINVAKGALNYVYHDSMTEGLTFNADSVKVYMGDGEKNPVGNPLTSGYTLKNPGASHEGWSEPNCTFEIVFDQSFLDDLTENDYVVIEYTAVLNENAKISGDSNDNTANLTYGDKNTTTNESQTKTYTGGMNVFKYTGTSVETGTPLGGAKFTLSASLDENEIGAKPYLVFVQLATNDPNAEEGIPTYRPAIKDANGDYEAGSITEIETIENGRFKIVGLDAGTYYLTETQAPEGYNKLAKAEKVDITDNAESVVNYGTANVLNQTGLQLPSTGGIGTVVLYVIGGLLVLGAIVVLVRRRSSAK